MNILLIFPGFIIAFAILFYYEYKIRQIRRTEPMNKVHFYVARDKNGWLWLYMGKPVRGNAEFYSDEPYNYVEFSGSIELFGLNENDYANLKWEDEPVEVFLNMED